MYKNTHNNTQSILEKLKKYCVLQNRCKSEIKKKIKRITINKEYQDNILKILSDEKYIDEERYAISFCRGKFKINKWGKNKIRNELKKKQVPDININKGLSSISDIEYYTEIEKQYKKKKKTITEKNILIKKNKIVRYLINKGYESNLVWEKLRELKE